DFGRAFRVNLVTQGGVASRPFPFISLVQDDPRYSENEQLLDSSFPAFFRMQELAFPFASSLSVHPDKQPDAKVKVVARTSPRATTAPGDTVDLKPLRNWADQLKKGGWDQIPLAATAEGTLNTAFPEGDKQGVDTPAKSAKPGRVLVIS